MEIIIAANADGVAIAAADVVTDMIRDTPNAVLGLATGSSPLGLYAELAARVADGLDMTAVRGFALDEYVGLTPDDPRSYAHVIDTNVTGPLRLDPGNVHVPAGVGDDLVAACRQYEDDITRAGGIDLQILGIGRNGHLGFNEPASSFDSRTRIALLAESTRRDNARFFERPEDVPVQCVTQGLGTIMEARTTVLIATGTSKAEAITRAVRGPVSTQCPASILQRHQHAVIIVDEAAAAGLRSTDDYRHADSA
ncbi:glucosamine-6-phosphate deaminase [Mycolicibacterium komossense]|uniref:glucosamine-6-phosphate deaminase n=1 Tax=Mycolicibacterium komossense TaxID=1779 RepID=UPI0021F36BC2|nr:glucosamine-6-phosphate deaminase [Mycolicibacterium komossense]